MSIWTTWCWPYVMNWLEHGTNATIDNSGVCIIESLWNESVWIPPFLDNNLNQPSNDRNSVSTRNNPIINSQNPVLKWKQQHECEAAKNMKNLLVPVAKNVQFKKLRTEHGVVFQKEVKKISEKLENRDLKHQQPKEHDFVVGDLPKRRLKTAKKNECFSEQQTRASLSIVIETPQSLLGHSIASGDINNDGLDEIIIGSPGNAAKGSVFLLFGMPNISGHEYIDITPASQLKQSLKSNKRIGGVSSSTIQNPHIVSFIGSNMNDRFGFSVASLDFNLDGFDDMVISAPGFGASSLKYTGKVYIYFGKAGIFHDHQRSDLEIVAEKNFTNLGMKLGTFDVDGDGKKDLLIGSPYVYGNDTSGKTNGTTYESGEVWIFLSDKKRTAEKVLYRENADLLLSSDDHFSWFGHSFAVITLNGRSGVALEGSKITGPRKLLLVGAPGYNDGTGSYGKLHAFDISEQIRNGERELGRHPLLHPSDALWTISGIDSNGQLGFSVSSADLTEDDNHMQPVIALSVTTKEIPGQHWWSESQVQAGSIYLFRINSSLKGEIRIDQMNPLTVFQGSEEFARLGWEIGFSDLNNDSIADLWATEPFRHTENGGADAGALYVWLGGKNFPTGIQEDCRASSNICIYSSLLKGLFGRAASSLDFNGDGFKDMLIGAPRDNFMNSNAGSVTLLIF